MNGLLSPCCSAKIDVSVSGISTGSCSNCGREVCKKEHGGRIRWLDSTPDANEPMPARAAS